MNDTDQSTVDTAAVRDAYMRLFLGDDIATAIAEIAVVADFELSEKDNRPFVDFILWMHPPEPAFIATWRSDPVTERKHYLRLMSGLEAARGAFAASLYHLARLREMEEAVHAILERFDFSKSVPPGSVAAIGNTRRWGFEYQAFVLAYRRTLDGLAWCLSTYFKAEQSSFRQFAKALPKHHPAPVATALAAASARHMGQFDFVIGTERGLSVRDRIAHRESVQAGCINVGPFGHRIIGGGEQLGMADFSDRRRLADVLQIRVDALHACVTDLLVTFRVAVMAHEAGNSAAKADQ